MEEENKRLKNGYEAFRDKTLRPLEQKNRELKQLLTEKEEELQKTFQKLSKFTSKCEKLEKQQTEIIEKFEQELKKERDYTEAKRMEVWKFFDANKDLRKKLDDLKTERETQEEEIEKLRTLAEEWKDKIDEVAKLEAKNKQLKERLDKETNDKMAAERRLEIKDANYKEGLEKKDKIIGEKGEIIKGLEKGLENTRSELTKSRAELKELKTSEWYLVSTMSMIQDEEELKQVKNDNSRSDFQKNTFQQKQNTDKKKFYSNRKGKKGKKYVEYNGEFEYEN